MTTNANMIGPRGSDSEVGDELIVERSGKIWTLTMNRLKQRNSLSPGMVHAFNRALDQAERDVECRMIVLRGRERIFSTGLDFEAVSVGFGPGALSTNVIGAYMELLMRLSSMRQVVVAKVEGLVLAGGVGCVAASDLVVADPRSQFGLSEALWGLLPACVAPFLIRRVGFQNAYRMTLTTETVSALDARAMGLVDVLTDNPDDEIRRQMLRIGRLDRETIGDIKSYFHRFAPVDRVIADAAVAETTRLLNCNRVRDNILRYVSAKRFPWEH